MKAIDPLLVSKPTMTAFDAGKEHDHKLMHRRRNFARYCTRGCFKTVQNITELFFSSCKPDTALQDLMAAHIWLFDMEEEPYPRYRIENILRVFFFLDSCANNAKDNRILEENT